MRRSALLTLTALFALACQPAPEALRLDVVRVERAPIHAYLRVTGRVLSRRDVAVTAPLPGRVLEVAVGEGDAVVDGALLAKLDDRDAASRVAVARLALHRATEERAFATTARERAERLYEAGGLARRAVESAVTREQSLSAQQLIAREELANADLAVERMQVRAPFDGVVSERMAEVGQWVAPSAPLFRLIDPEAREIEARVDAGDVAAMTIGGLVRVTSEAFPGEEWTETVTRLAPAVERSMMSNTLRLRVSLAPGAALRVGQQVDLEIHTASKEDALVVPFAALFSREGRPAVALVKDGRIAVTEVRTGIESVSHTEIVSGVPAGATLALPGGQAIEDGAAVEPVARR